MLRRGNRTFAVVAIVTLALGIGANAAIFTVVNAVLLRPLPYPDADRLVRLKAANPQAMVNFGPAGPTVYPEALRTNAAFAGTALYIAGGINLGGAPAERLAAAGVTPEFFALLGVPPLAGRLIDANDPGDAPLAVLSDALWRRRFGADPSAIGRGIQLNGRAFTIVGVAARQSMYPDGIEVWIPAGADVQLMGAVPTPHVIARLAPGVTADQARQQIAAAYFAPQPVTPERLDTIRVMSLKEELVGDTRPIALLVAAAAALILLVACINVANLLLARIAAREREFAIRRALGATSARIVRALFGESVALAGLAGLAALPAAAWTLPILRRLLPSGLHGVDAIAVDRDALILTAALSFLTAVLFGLAPAVSLRRGSFANPLRASATTTASRAWRLFRSALIVVETAIALLLLAGSAAIVSNVSRLSSADVGARRTTALTFAVTLPPSRYGSNALVAGFFERAENELRALPGFEAAGAVNELPGDAAEMLVARPIRVEGLPAPTEKDSRFALALSASPGYFASLGIPLLAGRTFTPADRPEAAPVAIVSQGYARALGLSPAAIVNRRVFLDRARGSQPERWADVVGVVGDVKVRGPEGQFAKTMYQPMAVAPPRFSPLRIVVAASGSPQSLVPLIRAAIARVDPDVPIFAVRTFAAVQAEYLAGRRFAMDLIMAFGVLAVVLTATGLFGVIAYLVELRTREIGIRMAIGATRAQVGRGVLVQGVLHALAGSALGLAGLAFAARVIAARMPTFWTIDAWGCAGATVFVIVVAIAAVWVPASRAMRVDPLVALRVD